MSRGSVVYHEHRGTIGKNFSSGYIEAIVERNHLLFLWKNIHEKGRLASNLFWLYVGLWIRLLTGPSPARPGVRSTLRALQPLANAARRRARRARQLAVVDDTEAFRRPLGGYFRDRFGVVDPERDKLSVLFVSPYPIEPPLHGGAVFMNQTVRHLSRLSELHLLCLLDEPADLVTNRDSGTDLRQRRVYGALVALDARRRRSAAARRRGFLQRRVSLEDAPHDAAARCRRAAARLHAVGKLLGRTFTGSPPSCSSTTSTFSRCAGPWAV